MRKRRGLRCVLDMVSIFGVLGKGGGCVVFVVVVWKKALIVGAVRMCNMGRSG